MVELGPEGLMNEKTAHMILGSAFVLVVYVTLAAGFAVIYREAGMNWTQAGMFSLDSLCSFGSQGIPDGIAPPWVPSIEMTAVLQAAIAHIGLPVVITVIFLPVD